MFFHSHLVFKKYRHVIIVKYLILVYLPLFYIAATLRLAGSLEKSTEVMRSMQQLVKIPEISATMQELSKEMMKVCLPLEIRLHHVLLLINL